MMRLVMSSRVGPSPPVVMTAPVRASAALTASRISSGRSATEVRRTTRIPTAASWRPISAPLVSTVKPSRSSVPIVTISRFIARSGSADPLDEEPPVAVAVQPEGVDGEHRRDREGDGDEAPVEGVQEVGEAAGGPPHRLPRIAEGEPEDDGADEDVLEHRLQLARAAGGDDDAAALRPPAERGHRQLAADQQHADPERDAAPDRDVVKIVAGAGD